MITGSFGLPWLLPAPSDFKSRARAALAMKSLDQAEVRKLAAYALGLGDLEALGKIVRTHRSALIHKAGFTPVRLGIASSHTMHYVAAALPGTALRHNLVLDVALSGLGQAELQPVAAGLDFDPTIAGAILIALDYRGLGFSEPHLDAQAADSAVRRATDYVAELAASVRASGAICMLQTLVPPASPLFGNLDSRVPGSARAMVERFNECLVHTLAQDSDMVLDAAFLASAAGLSAWNCARDWNHSRLSGPLDSIPLYADHICRLLGAALGRTRKCLVMDLDGTLWGGAIRRDGLQGIRLGQGTSVGEAHVALQQYVLDLKRRGVILGVCSGNNEAYARLPFRAHPSMVLKEDHIEFFLADEYDKVGSIREIAAQLKIGVDSFVFLDYNPAERALIREILPEVAVPELTEDPADYADLLSIAGYFEAARFPAQDCVTAEPEPVNLESADMKDIEPEEELEWLEMVATVSRLNPAGCDRAIRLMTSHRARVTELYRGRQSSPKSESLSETFCLQISLEDRFGSKGVVCIVSFVVADRKWCGELWLLRNTVSGCRVDELALASVAQAASGAGVHRLVLSSAGVANSGGVAARLTHLGFSQSAEHADGERVWALDLTTYEMPSLPFAIIRPN